MEHILFAAALFAGSLLPIQAGANAQLSRAVQSPFGATALQLGVGALLLMVAAAVSGSIVAIARLADVPWWHAVGGLASAFYVVSTILLFPRLGAVVSVGLFITGQVLASTTLDLTGLLGVPRREATPAGLWGTIAVLGGAALLVAGQVNARAESSGRSLGWIVLALAAGAVLPVQGAVNALLARELRAPLVVGTVSFVVAAMSMGLVILALTRGPLAPRLHLSGLKTMPWWGWLGGFAGATYVTTVFTAIPVIGAAAVVSLTVAGQQLASVLVDRFGWFRLPRRPVSALRLAGVGMLLAGTGAMKLL